MKRLFSLVLALGLFTLTPPAIAGMAGRAHAPGETPEFAQGKKVHYITIHSSYNLDYKVVLHTNHGTFAILKDNTSRVMFTDKDGDSYVGRWYSSYDATGYTIYMEFRHNIYIF